MTDTLDVFIKPFEYSFMVRALVVSVCVGVMCPLLGVYVVNRGLGFMGDAMAHSVMPGMVLAFILGISPFLGAIPTGIAVAFAIGYLGRKFRVSEDTSLGIMFAALFSIGLVMISLSKGISVRVEDILLGQILAVSSIDVVVTLSLAVLVLIVIGVLHRQLVFTSFDSLGATVIGLPTRLLDYLLLVSLALVIVVSLQAVGIVLVVAMLITPAAAGALLVRRFTRVMLVSVVVGVFSAVCGLYAAYHLNIPSGPSMTLVATAIFFLALTYNQIVTRSS
ncbi:MAG: metal ABC transporter permease [Chloroflexota bacterium]|jgi:ABC-type Mn2+/Zn2+ transport system permease subunit|nr:metal ABC transporter permease [Chloroflexota bacterium]|tara:strand:- start:5240 stop:6073 length:834 start_codon:yes stop_codon:yes gene_type:complete